MPYYGYGYGFPGYGMYLDPTYFLVLIGVVLCLLAQWKVQSTYNKYSRVISKSGFSGRMIAQKILNDNMLGGVDVRMVRGNLTDHFDPRNFTVNLSESVYDSRSIAAIAVASHECGHVLQHKNNYLPYNFRHTLVPVANFGSGVSWILILLGIFMGYTRAGYGTTNIGTLLINLGIICFSLAVLFQIVTLPVEFNASRRALRILTASNNFSDDELRAAREVLNAAALTYVAGAASAILQLLRILLLFGGRRRD